MSTDRHTFLLLALVTVALLPSVAAHSGLGGAVETRFAFPPWMTWAAGAAVVALSFAIVGGFWSRPAAAPAQRAPVGRIDTAPGLTLGRGLALLVLAFVVANAFRPGSDSILPQTVVWLVFWALLPLVAYTLGDPWPRLSPFEALRPLTEALRPGRGPRPYPERLAAWPAVVLLLAMIGLEVSGSRWAEAAAPLALLVFGYVFVTLIGMAFFGTRWLEEAEVGTRMLRWWGAAAPVVRREGRWSWRGVTGALERLPVRRPSDVAFTIALLYGVNFDALLATPFGDSLHAHLIDFGVPLPLVVLLLGGFLLFLTVWFVAARGIRKWSESLQPVLRIAQVFAASLLPIAVAYHLAHNAFTLVENLPRFALAVVDPLGFDHWPGDGYMLPTHLAFPTAIAGALGAIQVAIILAGHVVAVIVAHHIAFGAFPSRVQAVKGEVPLTLVMVAYTWTGLWLLSAGHGGAA